ncbi:tetratricopeptide repeat protein [Aquimarina sp. 2304DJ70-9]|uniref:tetratricopeptide repeat protein n=1 Tax=Aquimarina penaris TaxID=3231044 RepID=UPI0034635176
MSSIDKDIVYIERFFNLELSEDELLVFEARIDVEPDFARKLDAYKESMDLVEKKYISNSEKARVEKWRVIVNDEKDAKIITPYWKWIAGIAASIVLIFFGWRYSSNTKQQNLATITQASWDKKIGLDYRMMRTTNRDSLQQVIINAFDAYEEEKFKDAITILEPFISTTLYYEDALLIKGLSEYKAGNVSYALKTLETLSKHPSGKKAKVALWYQGLIYLDLGDKKAAKKFLFLPNDQNKEIRLKE